jgi:2-polyprenyl-6-methoxyphenol hydroxylase-like FAD-dependent oxidoreductase
MTTHYQVVVVGGGTAGVAAAIAAARTGASTLLLEPQSALGGMGSNAQVHTLCGLYHPDVSRGPVLVNEGIPTEVTQRLLALHPGHQPDLMGRVYVLRHEPTDLACVLQQMIATEPHLQRLSNSRCVGLLQKHQSWLLQLSEGSSYTAHAVVDATGDAVLAQLLGPEHWQSADLLYRPAYIATFPTTTALLIDDELKLRMAGSIARAVKSGVLPPAALGSTLRSSPTGQRVFLSTDLEAAGAAWNPLASGAQEEQMQLGAELAEMIVRHLRQAHPELATLGHLQAPQQLGVRESLRWRGDHVLTGEELLSSKRWAEEVALASWPLEIRETAGRPKFRYPNKAEPAGIPAGSLRSSRAPGIFCAGRCISCDHLALASVRVMGTCLATGQAAGRMAASWGR